MHGHEQLLTMVDVVSLRAVGSAPKKCQFTKCRQDVTAFMRWLVRAECPVALCLPASPARPGGSLQKVSITSTVLSQLELFISK